MIENVIYLLIMSKEHKSWVFMLIIFILQN